MSSEIAIRVQNLSKCYQIYDKPQDRLKQGLWRGRKQFFREFWALKDVSFEVKKGQTVGIIGRNGSGKSTLLQLICGTLTPTSGEVEVDGRVAALLELGAGFNSDFTGRENVYMNGAILGFSREQVDAKFQEIAEFAEIGEFMEQPVKTYSSGMFVRLAFAVQVCVEPDILVVDEALAVGDVFFRQKCYRRLESLRERGVSILLVSHALSDVQQFCQRTLLLNCGHMIFLGTSAEAVNRYYLLEQENHVPALNPLHQPEIIHQTESADHAWPGPETFLDISQMTEISNGWAHCTGIALCNAEGTRCHTFEQGETARFFYEFEVLRDMEVPIGGVLIRGDTNVIVHGKNTLQYHTKMPLRVARGERVRFQQDITLEIASGEYTFDIGFATISSHDYEGRQLFSHSDLEERIIRVCQLPEASHFVVVPRQHGSPTQLLHHGLANLPGQCAVTAFRHKHILSS